MRHRYFNGSGFSTTSFIVAKIYSINLLFAVTPAADTADIQDVDIRANEENVTQHELVLFRGMKSNYFIKNIFNYLPLSFNNFNNEPDVNSFDALDGVVSDEDLFPHQSQGLEVSSSHDDYTHSESSSELVDTPIRILSYNVWNYNDPWKDRLEIMSKQIVELDPTIIGFQEVR